MAEAAPEPRAALRLRRPDLRDLRWAAFIAALLAISPLTGAARPLASAALGAVGGAVVLGTRLLRPRPVRRPDDARLAWPGVAVALALVLVALAFAPTAYWLFEKSVVSVWKNAHSLFVPIFMFLLGRSVLRRDPHPDRVEQSAWGFLFLAIGLALVVIDTGAGTRYVAAFGLVIALPGVSLLLLGARRTRALAGVLALAIFLIPTPSSTSDPIWLAEGSSVIAEQILDAIDIPATRRETYFLTRAGEISVSQNCSGLSTVHASFALAFALFLAGRGGRRPWLPLLVAYPATLALNALRLTGIIWASHHMGMEFLHTALHGFSGLAVIWSTLALVWLASDHAAVRESLS